LKNTKRKIGLALGLLGGAILLSSCTASFCSTTDQAEILYPYEQGVTIYANWDQIPTEYQSKASLALPGNNTIYKYVPETVLEDGITKNYSAKKTSFLQTIITSARESNYRIPSKDYFEAIDDLTLKAAVTLASGNEYKTESDFDNVNPTFITSLTVNDVTNGKWCINPYVEPDANGENGENPINLSDDSEIGNSILRKFGSIKFKGTSDNEETFGFLDMWTQHLKFGVLGIDKCPSTDFYAYYKQQMLTKVSSLRNCIATKDGYFGHYGENKDWQVQITHKSWSYAWDKGFLEGLLVYPVSWLVDTFAFGMDSNLTGWSQLLALIFVTLIVRGIMLIATFKNTLSQQKMQALQPQLAKLQQKYPNSNTNQAEKQRLAQEQMALYKRNKVNPMGSLIVLIFQFPIFICVWAALQGSAALSTGSFLNLALSDTIKDTLFNLGAGWAKNTYGWWTALILFILMAGAQIVSMLLPQIFTKKKTKEISKFTANPAAKEQGNKTKTFMICMLGMTIVMGFFLPSAMGVYWFIGAIISIIQTLITQLVLKKKD